MKSIGVLGAGSFGTAVGRAGGDGDAGGLLWARRPELARRLAAERVNEDYLPGVEIAAAGAADGGRWPSWSSARR